MTTKKSTELTLKDKLSRLTFQQACKLLGEHGERLINQGADIPIDIDAQVRLTRTRFELRLFDDRETVVTLSLDDSVHQRLRW